MLELRKTKSEIEREIESDIVHLKTKCVNLIDKWILTRSRLQTKRWQLEQMRGTYVLPDGRTR